jgi:hypothetical protein
VCKVRWVVCGYSQIKNLDYFDTYSPTTTNPVVFLMLSLIGMFKLEYSTFDISCAFLEGRQDIPQYAWMPLELTGGIKECRDILGNWYGTKQGPLIWNVLFDKILTQYCGMTRCPVEPCLYYKFVDEERRFVALTIHVDDGLIMANCRLIIKEIIAEIMKHIKKMSNPDSFKKFLGMDIEQCGDHVCVSHKQYIAEKFQSVTNYKKVKTPMITNTNLRAVEKNPNNNSILPLTGTVRFMCDRARPDLLVATGELSSGGADEPSDQHLEVADRLISYILSTADRTMKLGGAGPLIMFAYSDASYITEGKSRCRIGGCIFYGFDSGAVLSYSRNTIVRMNFNVDPAEHIDEDEEIEIGRESSLSHSSAESEIYGIDEILREIIHQRDINKCLRLNMEEAPTRVIVDTKSGKQLVTTLKTGHKTKHINMRINFIREAINSRIISLFLTESKYNVANVLTKPTMGMLYEVHSTILMEGHGGKDPFENLVACVW